MNIHRNTMNAEHKLATFIEAKSAARKTFNDLVFKRAENADSKIESDDLEFIRNDYIVHVVEFYVLLKEYKIENGESITLFARKRNESIEERIGEIRESGGAPGIIATRVTELQRGLFSDQALERLEWIMRTYKGIEQASLARFMAGYMSDTWLKRCLKILSQLDLLKVEDNQFGGKVYTPTNGLFETYEETAQCFAKIWDS